ncbi:MAG: hypothetical protein AAGL89_03055 [Pseudomonadota bacterium]
MQQLMKAAAPRRHMAGRADRASGEAAFELNVRRLARWVGLIAVLLPFVLILPSVWSDTCVRDSISHHYYAGFRGSLFVASLCVIGTMMVVYRGDSFPWENRLTNVAGALVFLVALFPTSGHGCDGEAEFTARPIVSFAAQPEIMPPVDETILPDQTDAVFALRSYSETIHVSAAILFFVFLLIYSTYVFPAWQAEDEGDDGRLKRYKVGRNLFYYAMSALILLSLLVIGHQFAGPSFGWEVDPDWNRNNRLLWWESVALIAFGAGWLVKGRLFGLMPER